MFLSTSIFLLSPLALKVQAACYDPSPAFAHPKHNTYNSSTLLPSTLSTITSDLHKLISNPIYDTYSFSIEITTSVSLLWEHHHTARSKNPTRPGAVEVKGDSVYRVASITKAFTTLAIIQQHVAGNLSIDDPIDKYLDLKGDIPWKDITLRTAASQLSGIPRELAQADLFDMLPDPLSLGLPPATPTGLTKCDTPCTAEDLLEKLATMQPLWLPKQKSTYSNVNFDLLGLVVENVTGVNFVNYVEKFILDPLHMNGSSFTKPDDSLAVLPLGENWWDAEEGVQRPTGGLYSCTHDMSKFVRYVLSKYNGLSPQFNWFNPGSYSNSLSSYYGMPWEIFRTTSVLPLTSRPITFNTKGGGLPGYFTYIVMVPEYNLGISIFTAGDSNHLLEEIREIVTLPLIQTAEEIAQQDLSDRYTGIFAATDPTLNSSLIISQSASKSLYITQFISNSTDILPTWHSLIAPMVENKPFRIQLIPTLLFKDDKNKSGEIWRGTIVIEGRESERVWDDYCVTDLDPLYYAGEPLLEIVFRGGEDGKKMVRELEMSAFRVKMTRVQESEKSWAEDEKGQEILS